MFKKCYVCQEEILSERIEALDVLGVAPHLRTCLKHAPSANKGIWLGESGNSELIIASKVYNDRVVREDINAILNKEEQI